MSWSSDLVIHHVDVELIIPCPASSVNYLLESCIFEPRYACISTKALDSMLTSTSSYFIQFTVAILHNSPASY